jgi:hypothetical protein
MARLTGSTLPILTGILETQMQTHYVYEKWATTEWYILDEK